MARIARVGNPIHFFLRLPWQPIVNLATGKVTRAVENTPSRIQLLIGVGGSLYVSDLLSALPSGVTYTVNGEVLDVLVQSPIDIPVGEHFAQVYPTGATSLTDWTPEVDTVSVVDWIDAIKAVTDNLPNSGALTSLVANAQNAADRAFAIKAITDALPNSGALTDLATNVNLIGSRLGDPGMGNTIAGFLQTLKFLGLCSIVTDPATGIVTMTIAGGPTVHTTISNADASPINPAQLLNRTEVG